MYNTLVIATHNKNKLKEFSKIFKMIDFEILSLDNFPSLPIPVEDGLTFEENAYKKAHYTAKILGVPALADDSGLVVEALSGKPGVFSARYAGDKATDDDNCRKLLSELKGIKNRRAFFHCVLSIAVPSGPALTYEAQCEGVIIDNKRGQNGFGYDPIFLFPELGKTFAELTMEEKSGVSHRGKALLQIINELEAIKEWLKQRFYETLPEKHDHSEFMNNDWSCKK